MSTTIQVSEITKQLLESYKKDKKTTYDAIIKMLIQKEKKVTESLAGSLPQLGDVRKEEYRGEDREFD